MNLDTVEQEKQIAQVQPAADVTLPPLQSGDRLSRAEFERRYQAQPEIKKAELVEGVVYVPSPTRSDQHGDPHFDIIGWLAPYRSATPGVKGSDNATLLLDLENEFQPDVSLRLVPEVGGQARLTENGYLEGPPELIVEIAASSAAYDLHDKKRVYARNGVQEYLVVQMYEKRVDWFELRASVFEPIEPDEKGRLRSRVFPGLWLQPAAIWANDLATLLQVGQAGLASPEHQTFVEVLQRKLSSFAKNEE